MPRRISSPILVGRDAELAMLRAALDRARGRDAAIVLVEGEAGVGKSRLIAEFARIAQQAGSTVLLGGSPMSEGDLPFAAIVEALRSLAHQLSGARLEMLLGPVRNDLGRLLPDLGVDNQGEEPTPGSAQTRLFEAMLSLLDRLGRDAPPAVLVLEDIHWADRSTRELIAYLARNLRDTPVVLVLSYRSEEATRSSSIAAIVAELDRSDRVERVSVPRLDHAEVRALLAAIRSGPVEARTVEEIWRRSAGNAFFAEELLAVGSDEPLPDTIRDIVRSRTARLTPDELLVLRAAAVAGDPFDDRILVAATGMDDVRVDEALRILQNEGIVVLHPVGGGSLSMRHGLIREALDEELLPAERMRIHRAIAEAMTGDGSLGPATQQTRFAKLADHWLAARVEDAAIPALISAGMAAEQAYAFPEALHRYRTAISLQARPRTPDAAGGERPDTELLRRAAEVANLAGEPESAVLLIEQVLEVTKDGPSLADALERRGRYQTTLGDHEAALESLSRAEAALSGSSPSRDAARVLASKARSLLLLGRYDDARHDCEEAISQARAAGESGVEANALSTLGIVDAYVGDVQAGLLHLADARQLVESRRASGLRPRPSRIGDALQRFSARAAILDLAGRTRESATAAAEGASLAGTLGVGTTWAGALRAGEAASLYRLGQWDEADAKAGEALESAPSPAAVRLRVVRALVAIGRGDNDLGEAELERAIAGLPGNPEPELTVELFQARAELGIWRRCLTEAREAIASGSLRLHQNQHHLWLPVLAAFGLRAEADRVEELRARRGSAELDEVSAVAGALWAGVTETSTRFRERYEAAPRELLAYPALAKAEYARFTGRTEPDLWRKTVGLWQGLDDPYATAYAQCRLGEALLLTKGSRLEAAEVLIDALKTANRLGAIPLAGEIQALGHRARMDVDQQAAKQPTTSLHMSEVPFGLSAREREVLALIAKGRTNREIADTLFITEKTTGHHVSNILTKVGARGRLEAASIAYRMGLLEEEGSAMTEPLQVRRTFLVSDVVGSMQLVQAIGDAAWQQLIEWHDRSLRAAFSTAGGQEIDHAGDGFFVAFAEVRPAVECAMSIQRTLADHRLTNGFAPSVRIGIHTADATRAGRRYSGFGVHLVHRIGSVAGAGEIVASESSVAQLRLPHTSPSGGTVLKGVPRPVRLIWIHWRNTSEVVGPK